MKNRIIIFLALIGLIGVFSSCEKDEERVYLLENVNPPELISIPDLTLKSTNADDTLIFVGTPVDPGFTASAKYYLEACVSGNDFVNKILLQAGNQDTLMQLKVAEVNTKLLKSIPEFVASPVDFRIRVTLLVDAGPGALGSFNNPLEYFSPVVTKDVTPYGQPRIDILNSGTDQNLSSPNGDGVYTGFVKLLISNPFTLFDPSSGTTYGGSDGNLLADGAAIVPSADGWHEISVNTNDLSYTLDPYSVAVVGAFTEWGTLPDFPMEYNPSKNYWEITIDLPVGPMKFRLNSAWDIRWGPGVNTDLPADGGTLDLPNSDADINITTEGNYTIHLTITSNTTGSAVFILNS